MVLVFDNDTRIEWPIGGHYAYVHKVDDGTPHDYFSFSWEKDTPEKSDFFHALADYIGYKEG